MFPLDYSEKRQCASANSAATTNRLLERATDTATLGNFSLHEAATDSNLRLGSTITLSGTASNTADSHSITITDLTPTTDFPTNNPAPTSGTTLTFTIYVVQRAHELSTPSTGLATAADGVYYGYKDAEHRVDNAFAFVPAVNAPVYYFSSGEWKPLRGQ